MSIQQHGTRIAMAVAGLVLAGTMVIAFAPVAAVEAQAQERYSVWDGVYTDEQATRGKEQYEYTCASCHIHDLTGDSIKDVPALAGGDFLDQWKGKTVAELFEYMSTKMPSDGPGTLGAKIYADIAAYVLQANKFPAGKDPLNSDSPRLAKTFIDREKK